jgi:hypothetical protein
MASQIANGPRISYTYKSDGALAAYVPVKAGSDVNHIVISAAETDVILGITQTKATAAEQDVEVLVFGEGYCLTAGALARDVIVSSYGSNGYVDTADSGDYPLGRLLEGGVAAGGAAKIRVQLCDTPRP